MQKVVLSSKDVLKVEFDGTSFDVSFPNLRQVLEFQDAIKECEANGINAGLALIDFLEKLGLPKSVSERLTVNQLQQISEAVVGSKKN